MKIKFLKLVNFRNYDEISFEFDDYLNIIYGKNGRGKTNIVEAIYLLALTKSFRTSNDKNMIKFNKNLLKVTGIIDNDFENRYSIMISDSGKKVTINDTNYRKLSDYISKLNVIVFSRDDLNMIKESPKVRRKMINIDISSFNNLYLKNINDYNKILKQRNVYLKNLCINSNLSTEYLDILTKSLIKIGKKIYQDRLDFINNINQYINEYFKSIMGTNDLKIVYKSNFNENEEKLLKKYHSNLKKEMMLGKTILGIHHDDFIFELNNFDIKNYGSEGQQKNAIISYKLAIISYLKAKNIKPIFILDDMFSELDREKINNILNLLNLDLQIFITTTEIDGIDDKFIKNAKKILIDNDVRGALNE